MVPIDEIREALWNALRQIRGPLDQLVDYLSRDVARRPILKVEDDYPNSVVVLAPQQIADDADAQSANTEVTSAGTTMLRM